MKIVFFLTEQGQAAYPTTTEEQRKNDSKAGTADTHTAAYFYYMLDYMAWQGGREHT